MPVTQLTTTDHIAGRLSWYGIDARIDDAPPDILTEMIDAASLEVLFYLGRRYPVATLATSNMVAHWTAEVATYLLCTRRGNPCPASVRTRYEEVKKILEQIQEGKGMVTDIANPNSAPAVVNHEIRHDMNPPKRRVSRDSEPATNPSYPTYNNPFTPPYR